MTCIQMELGEPDESGRRRPLPIEGSEYDIELDTVIIAVGTNHRAYREGRLVSDDEVALVFDPETFVPLSDPLVNIRATLQRALECGAIDAMRPGASSTLQRGSTPGADLRCGHRGGDRDGGP